MKKKVLGIGSPIVDALVSISEKNLKKLEVKKGQTVLVDSEKQSEIIDRYSKELTLLPGGCAANVLKVLARFGHSTSLTGKIGNDDRGKRYQVDLKKRGIEPKLVQSEHPTGQVLTLITPDGERSFCTFVGATAELKPSEINEEHIVSSDLIYLDGYTLFCEDVTEKAMEIAKNNNVLVAFDLCSPLLIKQYPKRVKKILDQYVDIVFMNEDEAFELTGKGPNETSEFFTKKDQLVVITMNTKGVLVKKNDVIEICPAFPVDPVDTTGAGDYFAGAFLHCFLSGMSIRTSCYYGAKIASYVVSVIGAELPEEIWKNELNEYVFPKKAISV